MFDFQIRRATRRDFATIIRLIHALLGEMYALSSESLTEQGDAWRDFETRIWQTLKGEEHGQHVYPCVADHLLEIADTIGSQVMPIGLIEASVLWSAPIFRPVQTLYIHAVYVLPRCRRRGVGTALLRAAIDWGQQQGCLRAQLSVLPHNPARQLYQQLGFTVFGLEMRKEMMSPTS
ncbi:MAG TPA: GNAT family N-acetyltransferase [Anaerolineae bacterium]|nr:GNAT family N-acetyltransferase [Anaerolineae bacterium]